jgi:L-iditol 2-dehydrogenase
MIQSVMVKPAVIEFHEVETPVPGDDQVLIQVKRIGVCGSDIHVYHGLHPYTSYPIVQGHEVSGLVAGFGKNVNGFKTGDVVTFAPQVTCGKCYPCTHDNYHICDSLKVMGFQTNGAGQEYFPVNANMTFKLPPQVTIDEAAMIEPLSVAVHAVGRGGDVRGKKVAVFGAGTIGSLTAQVAKAMGAAAVMVTDVNDYKIQKARECGIDFAVNTMNEPVDQALLKYFGPDKADLMLECVGSEICITQAVANARKGTTIVVVGVFGKKPVVDLGLVQDRELNLVGSLMYQNKDYEKAIDLAAAGKLALNRMITKRVAFKDYLEAYQYIEESKGNYLKVMIDL